MSIINNPKTDTQFEFMAYNTLVRLVPYWLCCLCDFQFYRYTDIATYKQFSES